MQNKMKDKKTYKKPEISTVESEEVLLLSLSIGAEDGEDADGFMSKGDNGWDDFEEFESQDTDSYSAANWRQNNLWDTNMWD